MRDLLHSSRINPPDSFKEQIVELAANGASKQGIARHFGVSIRTLNRWLEESDEFTEAFAIGRDRERSVLHNVLYRAATDNGNIVAAMFLLKSRHSYREGDQSDVANRVSINFNLPGAMTAEQYKTIEAVAVSKPKVNEHAD